MQTLRDGSPVFCSKLTRGHSKVIGGGHCDLAQGRTGERASFSLSTGRMSCCSLESSTLSIHLALR